MPKGIGYQDASKLSAFGRKKSKDEASLKKPKYDAGTERVIRGLTRGDALTRKEAEARVDKAAREAAKKRGKR